MNVLLGVTGSVAAVLTPKLQQAILDKGHEVKTVLTESARYFHGNPEGIYFDIDEKFTYLNESKVLHIELVKWADVLVIAPCTANTLAKIANGICDNLLTCCVRAWDINKKIIIAPAMNTQMWDSHYTKKHIGSFTNLTGAFFIHPMRKKLFCGDEGVGAMANIEDIIERID